METNVLYHHGVKGMRWGVRRTPAQLGRKPSSTKKKTSMLSVIKAKRAAKKKAAEEAERKRLAEERADKIAKGRISLKKMTKAELEDRIARLELEKKYIDARKNVVSTTRGKRFVDKFLDSAGDKIAENAFADIAAQGVKVVLTKGVNKLFNEEVVFTNNKKK